MSLRRNTLLQVKVMHSKFNTGKSASIIMKLDLKVPKLKVLIVQNGPFQSNVTMILDQSY